MNNMKKVQDTAFQVSQREKFWEKKNKWRKSQMARFRELDATRICIRCQKTKVALSSGEKICGVCLELERGADEEEQAMALDWEKNTTNRRLKQGEERTYGPSKMSQLPERDRIRVSIKQHKYFYHLAKKAGDRDRCRRIWAYIEEAQTKLKNLCE